MKVDIENSWALYPGFEAKTSALQVSILPLNYSAAYLQMCSKRSLISNHTIMFISDPCIKSENKYDFALNSSIYLLVDEEQLTHDAANDR